MIEAQHVVYKGPDGKPLRKTFSDANFNALPSQTFVDPTDRVPKAFPRGGWVEITPTKTKKAPASLKEEKKEEKSIEVE